MIQCNTQACYQYTELGSLKRHFQEKHATTVSTFSCIDCGQHFLRKYRVIRHGILKHWWMQGDEHHRIKESVQLNKNFIESGFCDWEQYQKAASLASQKTLHNL